MGYLNTKIGQDGYNTQSKYEQFNYHKDNPSLWKF